MKKRTARFRDEEEVSERPSREIVLDANEPVEQIRNFNAVLTQANTYDIVGISFRRGIPKKVPMRFYELFKSNGWFKVSLLSQ